MLPESILQSEIKFLGVIIMNKTDERILEQIAQNKYIKRGRKYTGYELLSRIYSCVPADKVDVLDIAGYLTSQGYIAL